MQNWRKPNLNWVILCLACIVVNSTPSSASRVELQSLESFIQRNDVASDAVALRYVLMRCSGLYSLLGAAFVGNAITKSQGETLMRNGEKNYEVIVIEYPSEKKFIADQILKMVDAYKDRYLNAKAMTGNFSDDPIIRSDLPICDKILFNK